MTGLDAWARKWGVPAEAVADLPHALAAADAPPPSLRGGTPEAVTMGRVRLDASRLGWRLWRNNVGACRTEDGRVIRYGLANETKRMNERLKSADLIGVRPVLIGVEHVGRTIGQFVALECKRHGWTPGSKSDREAAQARFLTLVETCGGHGRFTTGDLE